MTKVERQYLHLSALELADKIKSKEVKISEVLDELYDEIETNNEKYFSYVSLCKEEAYKKADIVQERIDSGKAVSPLAGVPISVKDNICTKGITTTCASKMLHNFVPTYNATVVEKFEEADMIIVGKTNMDEFAMGSTTETSYFGITRNPWDIDKVPGGSSGGSAAAVASSHGYIALGSDTGGSIRQPASFCGITGLKPTYGTVSRYGLVAFGSSLDAIGPMGKTALDCAALYEIISGKDPKDGTSMEFDRFEYKNILSNNVDGMKIGIPKEYFGEGVSEETKERVLEACEEFKKLGATVETFELPILKYALPTYYVIACAEACSNLSRYDGIKYGYSSPESTDLKSTYIKSRSEGFGMEVKHRIMLGNFVLSSGYYDAYYKKALQAKKLIQKSFFDAFEKYDVILGPVAPETASKIGNNLSDPLKMYMADIFTVMINIAGVPAISIPCGFDKENMPVGLQIIGKPFAENTIFTFANEYQKVTDFHLRRPMNKEG